MKAIVCTRYGPPEVLQTDEVEKPVPKDDEVLIEIFATSVTTGDCEIRRFKMPAWLWLPARLGFGIRGPRNKILGQELAGKIESVGKDVKRFKQGDRVFARTGFGLGAYAEYKCMPENGVIAIKPANMSCEEAACVPMGGLEALHYLSKGNIRRGQQVLINGAGGSIGTFAVQIAKSFGAEVTGVDRAEKLDMLLSIGADHIVDYYKEDFSRSGKAYDVILDMTGNISFSACVRSLKKNGSLLLANPSLSHMVRGAWTSKTGSKKVVSGGVGEKDDGLIQLRELIEAGKIRSVIDRRYPLEKMVEAHRYVDEGHKKGNVAIIVKNS